MIHTLMVCASGAGTIPPEIIITTEKPDIVIVQSNQIRSTRTN